MEGWSGGRYPLGGAGCQALGRTSRVRYFIKYEQQARSLAKEYVGTGREAGVPGSLNPPPLVYASPKNIAV